MTNALLLMVLVSQVTSNSNNKYSAPPEARKATYSVSSKASAMIDPLMLPKTLLDAVIGRADGETSQETVYFSVASSWILMWMILLGMAWLRNRALSREAAAERRL